METVTGLEGRSRREASRPGDDSGFLAQLGQRVRQIRGQRGMSRKLLAECAGVSERYLAQLEGGQGNISILLLRDVARALDLPLEELLAESADLAVILHMLRRVSPEQLSQAKKAVTRIQQGQGRPSRARRIALIGLRGAGKSTLGRLVAADLALPFVELNDQIAEMSGLSVAELFNLYGQEGYRRLERRCLEQVVAKQEQVVLATGGGIVADPSTFDLLLSAFHTVWLRAAPQEHMERVRAQGDLRPMAGNPEAMEELKLILSSREALYSRADSQLDTSGSALEVSRQALGTLLRDLALQTGS